MWSPAYYSLWMNRYPGVRSLKDHSDFLHYALAHGLRYYVIPREAGSATIVWMKCEFTAILTSRFIG